MPKFTSLLDKIENIKETINKLQLNEREQLQIIHLLDEAFHDETSAIKTLPVSGDDDFRNFEYYPGTVLIFDEKNSVIYQSKPFLGKLWVKGQHLGDLLNYIRTPELNEKIDSVRRSNGKPLRQIVYNRLNVKPIEVVISKYEVKSKTNLLVFINSISQPAKSEADKAQIDKEKRHEEVIRHVKEISNSFSDIFFILDRDLKFTFLAPSIERTLQYTYIELLGKGFDMLVPEWSGNTLKKNLDVVLALNPDVSEPQRFKIQLSGKYGRLNWYEVQISGIYSQQKKLKGYNGICRDISERLKYEEALRLAKTKAEESDRLKSAFLANMSHEIRTPLNGIVGFSSMLTNKHVPENKKEKYTDYISSSSKQLLAIINDIIDISKIEAGQLKVVKTEVDVVKLLNEIKETTKIEKEVVNKPDIRLRLTIPIRSEIRFMTDEIRLRQILINLLSNALKFTSEGRIEFGCEFIMKDEIRFFVKDTGVGIPANLQKSIFERFRQGDIERSELIAGTGLGLAISKGLIGLMGGEIDVKSKVGEGSEFFFMLPYKQLS